MKNPNKIEFPLHVFPKKMQSIIKEYVECYRFPVDYYAAAMLTAAGAAIGNKYKAEYKHKWQASALLYMAIVGPSSSGKSIAIEHSLVPLYKKEIELRKLYKTIKAQYADRMHEYKQGNITKEPERPIPTELIVSDATVEAICRIMPRNPHGLLSYTDELAGWLSRMNSYKSGGVGGDMIFWMEVWSGVFPKVNRANDEEPIFLQRPFISVLGGLTPNFLAKIAAGGRSENGFLARILFALADSWEEQPENDIVPSLETFNEYERIINFLYNMPRVVEEDGNISPIILRCNDKARVCFKNYLNKQKSRRNEEGDESMRGIIGKLDNYALRFALILAFLEIACAHDDDPSEIPIETMERVVIHPETVEKAIAIADYFRETARIVLDRVENPLSSLKDSQKFLYDFLPDQFTYADGLKILESANNSMPKTLKIVSESAFKRMLNNNGHRGIFTKHARGQYEKKYV